MALINSGRFLEAFIPLMLMTGIDRMSAGDPDIAGPAVVILGLMCVRFVVFSFGRRFVREVGVDVAFELRQRLYRHLEDQGPHFFSRYPTGDLMARAINDIQMVRIFLGMGTRLIMVLGFSGIVAFCFMMSLSASLTLLLLPVLPFIAVAGWFLAARLFDQSMKVMGGFSELSSQVQENLNGIRTVQTHGQEDREIERFKAKSSAYANDYHRLVFYNSAFTSSMGALTGVSTLVILLIGGSKVLSGEISIGMFTAFLFYLSMMLAPVREAGIMVTLFQRAASACARLYEILDHPPEIRDTIDAPDTAPIGGALSLRNLSYQYRGKGENAADVPALDGVSLELEAGEMVAVLGRVGSGKSTLMRVLVRLLDPPPGSVYVDGRDIRMLGLAWVRSQIALVPQDPFLFADELNQNISYDNPDRPEDQLRQALVWADLEDAVERFPNGLNTLVGERGVTLSGGQKQRTSLARGLIRQTPILLLDDCFSSVDTETEEKILSQLKTMRAGRTTLMVSHRVSTARHADRIVVLDDGKVVEQGDHETLMASGGRYAQLARLQTRTDALTSDLMEEAQG
jgi:ATP-binding cassette subfamily B protein